MRKLDNAYALIIGVDFKQKTTQVLNDAKAINNMLCNDKLCGYKEENITILLDKEATKENIENALDNIIETTDENSSFLFFYSGHGGYHDGKSFILPYGASAESVVKGKVIREKLSQMKSKRMIILFDCCHSAGFFDGSDKAVTRNISVQGLEHVKTGNLEGLAQEIDDEQGMAIITSSQADELSWGTESEYIVFTSCFMEVLKGQHKQFYSDEFIRMTETVNHIYRRVPEMSRSQIEKGGKEQTPYINLQMNNDFVVSYIPEEKKSNIVIDKFASTIQKTQAIDSKNTSKDDSWERDEGNNLLLFIHGFSGESKNTFGNIPKLLQSDSNFDGWAMKPLGYSHFVQPDLGKDIWAAINDVDKIAGFLKTSINYKFKKYDRIAIVAHSLGGLVAQKAIVNLDAENRNRISHLIMFGTPSNGIDSELLTKKWNAKYSDMSSDGKFIKSLRNAWNTTFNNNYPFKLKVAASTDDEFVSIASCHSPFDEKYCEIVSHKHLIMVKPEDKNDDAYLLILNTLTGNTFFNQYTNKEEINLTLGKYDAVVKALLPRKDDLDNKGLKQLIFALEGLERKEEVYDILNNHPVAKDNTDLMGILGGRHKRDYLKTFSSQSSKLAINYYSKALVKSVENKDYAQIYYHAINLAFMSIVSEENESKMMAYAKQALDATTHCRDNVWKYATVAEANMYIGDMEKAKAFYIKASENAPIREKISMHTNAYAGYVALMQTDNQKDEFIQFLKARLLS